MTDFVMIMLLIPAGVVLWAAGAVALYAAYRIIKDWDKL